MTTSMTRPLTMPPTMPPTSTVSGSHVADLVAGVPRLLAGLSDGQCVSRLDLGWHLSIHGPLPLAGGKRGAGTLAAVMDQAALRGRGGAGFPFARKLAAVQDGRRRPVVVVNACEGEPLSGKDATLLSRCPHLVLDGAQAAAADSHATTVIIALHANRPGVQQSVEGAIAERSGRDRIPTRIVTIPEGYVSGQASALVHFLNGGPAIPTTTPPRTATKGVDGRPTLVSNAETYAHVALIARHGAAWFRSVGTREQPGTTLVTLSGAVTTPGVIEVPYGVPLSAMMRPSALIRGVLTGGYAGTWISPAAASSMRWSDASAHGLGASLGAGIVMLLPTGSCGLAETSRIVSWMAAQSARQCGPCLNGLPAIAASLAALAAGYGGNQAIDSLHRWAGMVDGRGACAHPDGVVMTVRSALRTFAQDVDHHLAGSCEVTA